METILNNFKIDDPVMSLKELVGVIYAFNQLSTCICMLSLFFLIFLPLVGICAHLGSPHSRPLPLCVQDFID